MKANVKMFGNLMKGKNIKKLFGKLKQETATATTTET
jgi:hypothetical protein